MRTSPDVKVWLGFVRVLFSIIVLITTFDIEAQDKEVFACPKTETIFAQAPNDPNASPLLELHWYINENKSIWAGWDAAVLTVGANKVLCIHPQGTSLKEQHTILMATENLPLLLQTAMSLVFNQQTYTLLKQLAGK